MSNPLKGEVGFEVEKKRYVLCLDVNAICALEQELDITAAEFGKMLERPLTLSETRAIFWAGLREHHEALTLRDAGRIIQGLTPARRNELIYEGVSAAFPSAEPAKEGAAPARPRTRARKTKPG